MKIDVSATPQELGQKAADCAARLIRNAIAASGQARVVLSTGASQFTTLEFLVTEDIDWSRVEVFHLWATFSDRIIPFYWIDPLEEDAFDQVDKAAAKGIAGFKCICNRHYPCDDRPMQIWERIAKTGKPILFHSGILYSPTPSSRYNRPAGFEGLFDIPNLRFAMAHVSWPWHDEALAVYGNWPHRKHEGSTTSEMFIDTTPGTPRIYRREVLGKVYTIGYDIENNVIFGTDCSSRYRSSYTREILAMDKDALDAVSVSSEKREKYYSKNVLRFLGRCS